MNWQRAILVLALLAGVLLRLPRLDLRPMHTDEAVHAIKFGALLEQGFYQYDKKEYHGPTLNYFTLLPAWLASEKTLTQVNETTLRIVPVFFGFCLILLTLLLSDIGAPSAAFAALLSACSPAMVFYSRYYIQETLLVCFAFALIVAAYRHALTGKVLWAVGSGVCAGLMFATKETWIVSCGVMGLSLLGVLLIRPRGDVSLRVSHIGVAALSGCVIAILFFSSFFTHWEGVRDSILAYGTYFSRAGESARHGHPWYYYIEMLLFSKGDHGPIWTEAGVVLLAVAGIVIAFRRADGLPPHAQKLRVFLSLYALLMLIVSSALPYKTPWLVLGALQPLLVMAGCGLSALFDYLGAQRLRPLGLAVAGLLFFHNASQAYDANFVYYDDPVNPYVYSQPGDDLRQIADLVIHASQGGRVPVQVICSGDDYWPLPWYLRSLPQTGWWSDVAGEFTPTPLVLASPDIEPALLRRLYESPPPGHRELYVPLFDRPMFLRPGKEIRGYITLDLRTALKVPR